MKKVVVTGGNGRLGRLVIRQLLAHEYEVLNLDRVPPAEKFCASWMADLRHSGAVYEALKGAFGVVHLGAYQAPNLAPDSETFSNKDRKSTRLNSSHANISYAVFCLKKKT